jgi:hypothetical protein
LSLEHAPAITDADDARRRGLGNVVDAEQTGQLDLGVDLLAALADRGARRVLVIVHEPAWQAPLSIRRLDSAPPEHDAAIHLDDHRGRDLWVAPQDVSVMGAHLVFAPLDELEGERRAAVDAVVTHRGRA